MEKANERNLESYENSPGKDTFHSILDVDRRQIELTKQYVLPYKDLIIKDFQDLRREIDNRFRKEPRLKALAKRMDHDYPEGYCLQICDEVFNYFINNEIYNKDRQGLKALKTFISKGGIVNRFWGADKGIYFQNAIQIGSTILDVANDTVDINKPKVVFYDSLEESPIKNIESIEQLAQIIEQYWGYEVYPNIYFPNLAIAFPILYIRDITDKFGKTYRGLFISVATGSYLWERNMYSARKQKVEGDPTRRLIPFKQSHDFLFKSTYSERRLPKEIVDAMAKKANRIMGNNVSMATNFGENPDLIEQNFNSLSVSKENPDFEKSAIRFLAKMRSIGFKFSKIPFISIKV